MATTTIITEDSIAARIERLPQSRWHVRMRLIVGAATFFDAFDSVAIAVALPALVSAWSLTSYQIGVLISVGFAGQAVGALTFGWLAERIGRIPAATISIGIFAVMSLLCALAADEQQLLWCRALQGFGLGGEVPIAATYINEIAKARNRGRFFLVYECVFLLGLTACAGIGAYVVPRFGYSWMFAAGSLPALLILALRNWCPESPRWLASRGRLLEADRVMTEIERIVGRGQVVPPADVVTVKARPHGQTRSLELFRGIYLQRTFVVWVLWLCSYLITYGLLTWMPTIYRTVYHVSVQDALTYGLVTNVLSLILGVVCAVLIDRTGRKLWMTGAFFLGACPVAVLFALGTGPLPIVVALTAISAAIITTITITLYLYTPEIYPTRMRALGSSWATFWPRFSSFAGAYMIGLILPSYGVGGVFLMFAGFSVLGGAVCWAGAIETRGRILEELSP
jgi:putative MFS transporter